MSYGSDLWCYDSISTGRLVSGAELVAQAIYRRLTTARGTLQWGEDESIYGLDLFDFVGRVGTANAIDALPDVVSAEILKDDRVLTADVLLTSVTGTDGLMALTLAITATLRDADEAFTLTLAVSNVSVSVVGFTTA